VEEYSFALHAHIDINPKRNPVWDPAEKAWAIYADDPEVAKPTHENHHASFVRKDRAMRWIRQVLREHFPLETWAWRWPDGWDPATLPDDTAEEEAVRSCRICQFPRSEHSAERLAECDRYLEKYPALGGGPPGKPLLPTPALRDRMADLERMKTTASCQVLVDPGRGPIVGTVGEGIAVLPNMHPEHVEILTRVQALIVEAGGATVHLAQLARGMGVAVVLREDAIPRFPPGTVLSLSFNGDEGEIQVLGGPPGKRARQPKK
jgi:phosphohistidine swiveling domain-containing protein